MNSVDTANSSKTLSATKSSTSIFSGGCAGLAPAVPTDTCAILSNLLHISDDALRQSNGSDIECIPRSILSMLLKAMQLRDPSTLTHCQRIAAISSGVARLLGWDDEQRRQLETAALLHDLGKIGIPEHILKKPGKLSSEEYDFVLLHHHAAVNLLQAFQTHPTVVSMLSMLYHNFDGGSIVVDMEAIPQDLPLGARILAVADAYDSLNSAKPYRRGMTHQEVMAVLEEKSGSRYDGNVVRTLARWYELEGDTLFRHTEPFQQNEPSGDLGGELRNSIVLLSQVVNTLYQFQQLYDGYFLLDSRGRYCIWSDGMPGMTGHTLHKMLGRSWQPTDVQLRSLTEDKDAPASLDESAVGQVMKNNRAQFSSQLLKNSESRHFKVDVYTIPISDHSGNPFGAIQLLRNKSGVRRQSREYVELKLAATRDALTGVANRGQLETQLRHLLEDFHAHEGTRNLSVIFLDVDKFKGINDTYGHQTGDEVLVDLTRLLQHETYSGESIGRYGGEEFVVLCPDTDLPSTVRRAERLRQAIQKSSIGGVSTLNVTSSFGVSTARLGDTVQTLLERADNCLYRAKETGRNRTCWEGQDETVEEEPQEEESPYFNTVNGVFTFNDQIEVATSLELTAMKLHAFIREYQVIIQHQDHGNIKFRMGALGFTRRWGGSKDRQPLDVELKFESARIVSKIDGKPRTQRRVVVTAIPHGRAPDMTTFATRCGILIRELRAYLLGS